MPASRMLAPAALALVMACAPAAGVAQLRGPEVRNLDFVGNDTFSSDSLAGAIRTTETRCRSGIFNFLPPLCPLGFGFVLRRAELDEREIPRDVARLQIWYQRRGFREAAVDGAVEVSDDATASVRFTIVEGRPVLADSILFLGADELRGTGLLDDLPLRQGGRWSTLALDATRDTLVRRLRNSGYPYADVLRQTTLPAGEPYVAYVTFDIEPGTRARYGPITVAGVQHLSEQTVLRTLPFRSGDPYRLDQLADGQSRLFGIELVNSASITQDLNSEPDSIVPLFVQVQEGDPYRVRAGGGGTTAECANVEARWTSRNFLGGGRVLELRGRLSNLLTHQFRDVLCRNAGTGDFGDLTWVTAVDFAQPWIFSTRNSFNASLFAERQSVPDIFIRKAVGLQLALVRAVGPRTPLTLSYRPELSSLVAAEVLLCTGLLVCTREDIDVLTSAQLLAPVGLNLTRDLSNSLLNPTAGYRLVVDFEHASNGTLSEFRYDRAVVEGTWYTGLTASTVFATRIRGGWVGSAGGEGPTGIIPPQKRFYAGGANSVRGFAQSRLGPRVLVVEPEGLLEPALAACTPTQVIDLTCDASGATERFVSRATGGTRVVEGNAEVRVGLGRDFEAVTFLDAGQVWGEEQGIGYRDIELTPGVGLRWLSPVGPIRVDLGYNFGRTEQLSVVTTQIAPWNGDPDTAGDRLVLDDPTTIDYVRTNELAVLGPRVLYGETESRWQLHISIGQAF
jgi:outer membrane protein insertion porin family/translocation and assembly module TamA